VRKPESVSKNRKRRNSEVIVVRYRMDVILKNGNYYGTIAEAKSLSEAIEILLSKARRSPITEGRLVELDDKKG
jgi:hypothetical protein